MARIYTTEGKILSGDNFPQISIKNPKTQKDELFVVDDRQSTFEKIQKYMEEHPNDESGALELALGKEQLKKIKSFNLNVKSYRNLSLFVMAAIQDEDFETIEGATKEKN